jgi:ABC-2 type transport system permease protein
MRSNLILLRFKAFFSDKVTALIFFITVIFLMLIINNLTFHAEDRSSIPVGILDLDQSGSSKQLIEDLKKVPSLYVYQGREKDLREKMLKNEIKAYFILNPGYEKMIQAGKTHKLIVMKYLRGDQSAKILSDIVAGEMMYKICQYKSFNKYSSLGQKAGNGDENRFVKLTDKDYLDYTDAYLTSPDFDFAFDIKMVQVANPDTDNHIPNSVLYLKAVWGITAILLSFLVMVMLSGLVSENESGIRRRVKVAQIKPYMLDLSYFGVAFTVIALVGGALCFSLLKQIPDFSLMQDIRAFLLTLLFGTVMILWFGFLGKMAGTTGKYQIIGTGCVLIFGLFGFLPMILGLLKAGNLIIAKFTPNSWFIDEFTDIILNTNLENSLMNPYFKYVAAACGLLVLHGIINKRQFS